MYASIELPSSEGLVTPCLNQNVALLLLAQVEHPTQPSFSSTWLHVFAVEGGVGIVPPDAELPVVSDPVMSTVAVALA